MRHQAEFAEHGICARAADDPEFDRECFSPDGKSFRDRSGRGRERSAWPARRGRANYRPYAPRARWIRTANDSYFTAMTYPRGLPATMQPSNIHDATWGALSAVYGGAFHPSAEGHAAMADAALPAVRDGARPHGAAEPSGRAAAAAELAAAAARRTTAPRTLTRTVRTAPRSALGATPSFFCRLDDDVVYWNTSRLSG